MQYHILIMVLLHFLAHKNRRDITNIQIVICAVIFMHIKKYYYYK